LGLLSHRHADLPQPSEAVYSMIPESENLPATDEESLALMTKTVDKQTVDLDRGIFHDNYRKKIEALISSKLKGEAVRVEEKVPKKPVTKSMMEALRKTAESLK
jgi:non-homologous end joining protein Ku